MEDLCIVYVSATARCQEGSRYPGLLSTDKGARHVDLRCGIINNKPTVAVEPFKDVLSITKEATSWSLAVPLESGNFQSYRFVLRGTDQAWSAMQNIYRLTNSRAGRNSDF